MCKRSAYCCLSFLHPTEGGFQPAWGLSPTSAYGDEVPQNAAPATRSHFACEGQIFRAAMKDSDHLSRRGFLQSTAASAAASGSRLPVARAGISALPSEC